MYVAADVWTSIETDMTSLFFYKDPVSVCITNKLQSPNFKWTISAIGKDEDIRDSKALVGF